jgi:putative tryptophan/tyrosine transport system substrate-binding protein
MNRRKCIALVGGAATVWPLVARAQQRTQQQGVPVIGFLSARTAESDKGVLAALRQGLDALGYAENKNVAFEYHFADGHYDQIPLHAADLVRRRVAVIVATSDTVTRVAQAASTTIPIIFAIAGNPVEDGFVASLSRPGGNLTGVTNLNVEVGPKLLELLHQVAPAASDLGVLINPGNSHADQSYLQQAARALGFEWHLLRASTDRELDALFANPLESRALEMLAIDPDPFFTSRAERLGAITLRHRIPAIYQFREFVEGGGLMSYGGSRTDAYHQVGVYAGRILNGEKPVDLPVIQSTKIEFVINLKTAKALGLMIPPGLLAIADEVIE